jgi:type IV secretion system protein VirB9
MTGKKFRELFMRTVLFLAFICVSGFAQEAAPSPTDSAPASATKFDPGLLGGKLPELTEQERIGVSVTQAWRDKSLETLVSKPGMSSSAQFRFGESYPTVVAAILQVTDIELQPGEVITQINIGDSTRWSVESAKSGAGADEVEHLIVKPRDIGLQTSLVVTTDRRTYHLLLVSSEHEFMHDVTFLYADAKPTATPSSESAAATSDNSVVNDPPPPRKRSGPKRDPDGGKQIVRPTAKESGLAEDAADENYVVFGKADWKPVGVYSKDGKTYIELPAAVRHKEAPVLFEETKAGWFHHQTIILNYRVKGRWYVVDKVVDKGVLLSGVGANQQKVVIRHIDTASEAKQ